MKTVKIGDKISWDVMGNIGYGWSVVDITLKNDDVTVWLSKQGKKMCVRPCDIIWSEA